MINKLSIIDYQSIFFLLCYVHTVYASLPLYTVGKDVIYNYVPLKMCLNWRPKLIDTEARIFDLGYMYLLLDSNYCIYF